MPSPFPGMNPYLENDSVWQDFHQSLCMVMRDALVPQIRPDFYAKVNEHLFIHDSTAEDRRLLGRADVGITRPPTVNGGPASVAVLEAFCEIEAPTVIDVERSGYIEIFSKYDDSLVTVIELLSPTNKKLEDREQFIAKRREIMARGIHYVEIDLLRGNPRMPAKDMPDCDYCVLVARAERRPKLGLWPLKLHEPLPPIRIPLRPPHADAILELQQLLNEVYDAAGYEDHIYRFEPQPRLHPQDAEWARQFLPVK
ncbi:MAG: DUF4058 family protein [Gemmataceae bacterium]|nr:DUF4058 family protein [Gemmataceae bacterium]